VHNIVVAGGCSYLRSRNIKEHQNVLWYRIWKLNATYALEDNTKECKPAASQWMLQGLWHQVNPMM